jgi:demethylmenaquinone methyltransferase / 2-methoxy-6-polyprenyl-1,4-benzoquinol methylase
MSLLEAPPSRKNVGAMFDRIAGRYDLLNRLLSGRRDVAWRKKVAKKIPKDKEMVLLDLATGTGDLLFSIMNSHSNILKGIGIDISQGMLDKGIEKGKKKLFSNKIIFQKGDAQTLDISDESVDVVTIAFGIRNVENYEKALKEMYRVLKVGGKVLILEFSLPSPGILRKLYTSYFRHVLPKIGGVVSGDQEAYRYLNKSVESFPYGKEFCKVLKRSNFTNIQNEQLSFGIATIYQGEKHA